MGVLWLCLAMCGALVLGLMVWISAPLAARTGLGSFEDAVVTSRTDTVAPPPSRGSCRRYTHYEVEWATGTGGFGTCTTRAQWDVGDHLEVAVAPWSSEVSAEPDDLGWNIAGLAAGLLLLVHGLRASRHYRRLTRGGSGVEVRGTVLTTGRAHARVAPAPEETDPRRIVLIPATASLQAAPGDPVSIWSSRRGWTGRPRGPWVVRTRHRVSVATHLWRWPPWRGR